MAERLEYSGDRERLETALQPGGHLHRQQLVTVVAPFGTLSEAGAVLQQAGYDVTAVYQDMLPHSYEHAGQRYDVPARYLIVALRRPASG